jgi:cold shock CspA family protein
MTSSRDSVTPSAASEHLIGRVKWFNNKAGYGFITVTDGSRSGSDIFVHHSAINVDSQQYKYLIQGEYIEFDLVKTDSEKHEWQASRVSGIRGGKLMCETRRELKIARTEYKTTRTPDESVELVEPKTPRPSQRVPRETTQETSEPVKRQRAPRVRGEGPRDGDKKQWTLVGNGKDQKSSRVQPVKKSNNKGSTIITIESK